MPNTIFFSWQADTPTLTGRNLIDRALERAVGRIGDDTDVEEMVRDLVVDKDTEGAPGSPPVADTILKKIDGAAAFVPDLTFVGKRLDGRPTPNPNVLIEYGWALKSLTYNRIVPVMNTAYGHPTADTLPFDLGYLRHPIQYDCPDDADEETRRRVRDQLSREIERRLRTVLESDEFRASLPHPPEPLLFVPRTSEGTQGRFKARGVPIGVSVEHFSRREAREITLSGDPIMWLRVTPTTDPGRAWRVTELQRLATQPTLTLLPLSRGWSSYDYIRSSDGFGIYPPIQEDPGTTLAVVFAFTNGEVWGSDAYFLKAMSGEGRNAIPLNEDHYMKCLQEYTAFLVNLGIAPPYRWIAGMENLRGRAIVVPTRPGYIQAIPGPRGRCLEDTVICEGSFTPGESAAEALKPFFTTLFDNCGVERPDWLDG